MRSKANHLKLLLCALFLLAASCTAATGKVIYVDIDAVAEFNGSEWAFAYRSLQDAIAEVQPGDEIRVAKGIYRPDRRTEISGRLGVRITASGDRAATFELINDVTFKGGYAGYGEPDPNARDIGLYETILSGDLSADDVYNPDDPASMAGRAENSYHVVTSSGTDETAVLDGVTITGGNADGFTDRNGGGLVNEYGSPQIINCTFTQNLAQYYGGGMYNYYSNPTLVNCTFTQNLAGTEGGGIYNYQSNLILTNCAFKRNSAVDNGGGIYNVGSILILSNCIFTGNQARLYGGGMSCNNSNPILTNCTFAGNSAPDGSALACNSLSTRSIVGLNSCIFWNGGNEIWNNDNSIINISYSNIQGGWPGTGNIDADPLFADTNGPDNIPETEDDDFRLAPLSPCIDSGDPNYVSEPNETDFEGNQRIVGGRVDMGAYEFPGIIYVDNQGPADNPEQPEQRDPYQNGSEAHPFDTIQEAIDIAKDGQTVLVRPGVYSKIDFMGKAITVAGTGGTAVIEAMTLIRAGVRKEDAVTFHTGEGPGSVLKNFIIKNSGIAISLNYGSSPTITNLTIVDNDFGISAYENSNPDISNCIFWNNRDGDLFQCEARYSCLEGEVQGAGNISGDPLFVNAANDDYHLMSEGWRWNSDNENSGLSAYDDVTSRCIDAGDPISPLGDEPMSAPRDPNNDYGINLYINMGAYGGTCQASIPPLGWLVPE
ncbi:right-handed parallel beta-helix repeat-containing protein [Planctomycetota bacterium]